MSEIWGLIFGGGGGVIRILRYLFKGFFGCLVLRRGFFGGGGSFGKGLF